MNLNNNLISERSNWPPFLLDVEGNFRSENVILTFIIPTFNAANFISETLIRVRDIPSSQILILDDESTDQTIQIVRQLLKNHPNFAILKLTHKGAPGQARNFGALLASGKWIWCLDCDDLPMKSNLMELFEVANEFSSDMIILRYLVRYDQEKVWSYSFDSQLFTELVKSNYKIFGSCLDEPQLIRLSPHPSRIIYSREFILKQELKYDIDETFEDGSFWPRAMLRAHNILAWNWPELVYRVRKDSITHSQDLDRKLFLLTQFRSIFHDVNFSKLENMIFWGHTYMYGLEMIMWPLNSLDDPLREQYKDAAKNMLNGLGSKWFVRGVEITISDRISITKSLLRMGCVKLSIFCLFGLVK